MIVYHARAVHGALLLCLVATSAHAADTEGDDDTEVADDQPGLAAPPEYPAVSGNVTVGLFDVSGNTESESVNVDVETEIDYDDWRHTVALNGFQASEDGEESAERYSGRLQSDYRITERAYLFVVGRYGRDRFGAYDRRASVAVGLGRRFVDMDDVTLDLEAGGGRRVVEPDGTNERNYDTIGVLRGDFVWQLSEVSEFTQNIEMESGQENTSTSSVTAIRSKLAGNLSWRLSWTVEHNSDVPDDARKTDRYTTVSLQYGF